MPAASIDENPTRSAAMTRSSGAVVALDPGVKLQATSDAATGAHNRRPEIDKGTPITAKSKHAKLHRERSHDSINLRRACQRKTGG